LVYKPVTGGVTAPKGFKAAGVAAGIKDPTRKELALIYSVVPAGAAALYTTNQIKAAPLHVTKEHLKDGRAQAVVINSGNANACNGNQGLIDAKAVASEAACLLHLPAEDVLVASTGVIGQPLPLTNIIKSLGQAVAALSEQGGGAAAEAIMTTDTRPKEAALQFELAGKIITVGGMAKGAGMIHPQLATMLCFLTTDAVVTVPCLQEVIHSAAASSFNLLDVDGDTSTNDLLVILANGQAENPAINKKEAAYYLFQEAVLKVCTELAIAIARDGEGATKLLEVRVINAASREDACLAARAVAASNLVKTAVFGQDANWGRIICAVGYSGAKFNPDRLDIFIGPEKVAQNGAMLPFSEAAAAEALAGSKVSILVDFNEGTYKATAWGCDLTYDYIRINASYRT
jgi:glutamate N-acetyltransferase/amino-acid N-acetyltransferase